LVDLSEYAGGLLAGVDPALAVKLRDEANAQRRQIERDALQLAIQRTARPSLVAGLPYELWRLVDDHDPEAALRRTVYRRSLAR
jgi:hypothetical protein